MDVSPSNLQLEVLRQFRAIYGTMRQYFRELESCCGLPGSQTWVLQEVSQSPGIGVGELAERLGIHQSTCSGLVEKLVVRGYLERRRSAHDQRRVGLSLSAAGGEVIGALPGPAEGVLPQALANIPPVCLQTLNVNLTELIAQLPGRTEQFAGVPLAEMVSE